MRSKSTLSLPSSLLAGVFLFSQPNIITAQKDNGGECSCFRTNASAHYFANHIFRDFRNINGALKQVPKLITGQQDSANAFATADYFLTDSWRDLWTIQKWNNSDTREENSAAVLMINSPNNVYIGILCTSPRVLHQH